MNGIGLDCGNATLKLVLLSPEGKFLWEKTAFHYGAVVQSARRLLGALLAADPGACGCPVVITGNAGDRLKAGCHALAVLGEIPAIHLGVRLLAPEARSAIEIGSQSARFLTGLDQNTPPRFAVNEHCAGGTGSFFEDQMSRLGLKLEDYSRLVGQARSIGAADGETGRNREPLPQLLLKRSHNPGIVGNAALKHHAAPDGLGPNDLVEVVADNGPAQASRHLCLGGAPGECGLDGCLDKHRTPLSQLHRAGRAEGQRAELRQWDTHARGLLFYKGAGSGGADPVHLKVGHLSAP